MTIVFRSLLCLMVLLVRQSAAFADDLSREGLPADDNPGSHGFAHSGDVRIHNVTKGEGPLVIMIYGFPDYWYTWRKQMPALSEKLKVVAIHQRGYNGSGQPDDNDLTLVTVPEADYFIQQDAAALVIRTMVNWLKSEPQK